MTIMKLTCSYIHSNAPLDYHWSITKFIMTLNSVLVLLLSLFFFALSNSVQMDRTNGASIQAIIETFEVCITIQIQPNEIILSKIDFSWQSNPTIVLTNNPNTLFSSYINTPLERTGIVRKFKLERHCWAFLLLRPEADAAYGKCSSGKSFKDSAFYRFRCVYVLTDWKYHIGNIRIP